MASSRELVLQELIGRTREQALRMRRDLEIDSLPASETFPDSLIAKLEDDRAILADAVATTNVAIPMIEPIRLPVTIDEVDAWEQAEVSSLIALFMLEDHSDDESG